MSQSVFTAPTERVAVFKYGCRPPKEIATALQLLGQAWLYGDAIRRAYNDDKRARAARKNALAEASHVRVYEAHDAAANDVAHVQSYERHHAWAPLNDARKEAVRLARSKTRRGHLLDNGTYWLVEAAALQAAKETDERTLLRSPPFDGTGRIGAAIASKDQFPADCWSHPRVTLTAPNEKKHAELTIFVGELKDKRVITWPIKIHRPLPKGAVVKQIAVQRTREGHRFRWEALITVAYSPLARDEHASGVVGVDVGWRLESGASRVATHAGPSEGGLLLIDTLADFEYADAVRGTRDCVFNDAKSYAQAAGLQGAEHAGLWRNKERLRRVAQKTGDLGAVWWRERDRHLEDIECGVRGRAQRRRLDRFRTYADALAKRYSIVVLEDMPMQDWVGEGENSQRERRRSVAALSLLQQTIAECFGPARTCWLPSAYTSMTCADCLTVRDTTVGADSHWTCVGCGRTHHQDENAARVLRMNGERWIGDGNPPRARTRRPKKGKSMKQQPEPKEEAFDTRSRTSREPLAEAAE